MKKTVLALALAFSVAGCGGTKMAPAFHETARVHTPEQKTAYEECQKDPQIYLQKLGMMAPLGVPGSIAGQAIKGNPYGVMAAKSLSFGPVGIISGGIGLASAGISYAVNAGKRSKNEMSALERCLAGQGHKVIGWYSVEDPKGELQPPVLNPMDKILKDIEAKRTAFMVRQAKVPSPPAVPSAPKAEAVEPLVDDKTMDQVARGLSDEEVKAADKVASTQTPAGTTPPKPAISSATQGKPAGEKH